MEKRAGFNFKYEKIKQRQKIIEELNLENEIDKLLIERGFVDQEWFRKYKIEPYLLKRFPYYIHIEEHRLCQDIIKMN